MTTINLRDYYPFYKEDAFIEVSDEIVELLHRFDLEDEAHRIRVLRAGAYYSLDCGDGIENDAVDKPVTPDELLERELTSKLVWEALASLSEVQRRRVYENIVNGKSKVEIAADEKVDERAVRAAITRGLSKARDFFKKLPDRFRFCPISVLVYERT
jgi:RNA polymerase sigma-70 factor (ECF subfamily)